MPASLLTALALSVQIAAPALPSAMPAQLAESPQIRVEDVAVPPGLSLRTALMTAGNLEPMRDADARRQTGPQPSKRGRMVKGALIGGTIFAVLAMTVGQEACLGKPRWVCGAMGGGMGALVGALIARK